MPTSPIDAACHAQRLSTYNYNMLAPKLAADMTMAEYMGLDVGGSRPEDSVQDLPRPQVQPYSLRKLDFLPSYLQYSCCRGLFRLRISATSPQPFLKCQWI
jgi:hypothetical protein